MKTFDILVVADPRFAGGSTAALVADVSAMAASGLKVGLLFVRSGYLDDARDPANPKALALRDLNGVIALSPGISATAPLAFLHHPLVFARGIEERADLRADRAVLVAHHTPFRADGSLEYNPLGALRRARAALGLNAWIAPVSAVVRAQIAGFAPLLRQTSEDWPNMFDPADWPVLRAPFDGGDVVIGRHGRSDPLKFPATGPEIDAALPAGPGLRVRVLGCPAAALAARGAHPDRWEVLSFGAEPVVDFLNSLDIFTYHYHPALLEAFGRTVVEAALCGRPCLLDPRLQATFGDLAQYCTPAEVRNAVARIASDPTAARDRAEEVRRRMATRFGAAGLTDRLARLRDDPGDASRAGVVTPPLVLARKLVGHYRRRLAGADG
ncbi:glycosyltransferase family 1 protein [Jannaschia sp. S6380]|uniref:glycosyltransferase family 1 protein n=1 Tax=Jannaschia sp. S6380 TaxID=2926408 RepID=UPI001FF5B1C4|nr:glycosyltransferase family 1 protein [Jannaschia sp. S6380]MCK0168488.1 glycosyltransferase family 1 protein [Jannaschia sp. S6380]